MKYALSAALALFPQALLADEGLHHHPHGIDYGWIIACAIGVAGGLALAKVRRK